MSERNIIDSKFPKNEEIDSRFKNPEHPYIEPKNTDDMVNNENLYDTHFVNRFIRIMNLSQNAYSLSHPTIHSQLLDLERDIKKMKNGNQIEENNFWVKSST